MTIAPASRDAKRFVAEKLLQGSTYLLAFFVGTLINLYGQILVPWFRGDPAPLARFSRELSEHPLVSVTSVMLAYVFPLCVGVYSSVSTRCGLRDLESRALFADLKPGPVFRANRAGEIIAHGEGTARLFEQYDIRTAQTFLGDYWHAILSSDLPSGDGILVRSERLAQEFIVSFSVGPNNTINVYASHSPRE